TLKHGFVGHPKIILGVVGRYVTFVAEEEMNLRPRYAGPKRGVGRQQRVQTLRRRAAGQRNGELISSRHCALRQGDETVSRRPCQRRRIREHLDKLVLRLHLNPTSMLGSVTVCSAGVGRASSLPICGWTTKM